MFQVIVVIAFVENSENLYKKSTQREMIPFGTMGRIISLRSKVILGNKPSPFSLMTNWQLLKLSSMKSSADDSKTPDL